MANRKTSRFVDMILLMAVIGCLILVLIELANNILQALGS